MRQCGLIAGIELVRDKATKEPYPWPEKRGMRACDHARGEGVLLRPLGNVIVVMPRLVITLDEVDRIAAAVERGIVAATEDWPRPQGRVESNAGVARGSPQVRAGVLDVGPQRRGDVLRLP